MDFRGLEPAHNDAINDVVFDYYGKRIATCSSDRIIKVWTLNSENTTWSCVELKGHGDIVWRTSWAHPEFGQILASCSDDSTVRVWEELEPEHDAAQRSAKSSWQLRATITSPSKRPVKDVKFSHKDWGLKLAFACADGYIYFYEAADVFDPSSWEKKFHYHTTPSPSAIRSADQGVTSICWNLTPFEPPRIAAGGYASGVTIYCVKDGYLDKELDLPSEGPSFITSDIAWAPVMGRSYHLVAVASREKRFRIHKISREDNEGLSYLSTDTIESPEEIWRLSWNATGTVLASSAQNGKVSLWRRSFNGAWETIQSFGGEGKNSFIPLTA